MKTNELISCISINESRKHDTECKKQVREEFIYIYPCSVESSNACTTKQYIEYI